MNLFYAAYRPLQPTYMINASLFFLQLWLFVWSTWMSCEISGGGFTESASAICFQVNLDHKSSSYIPSNSKPADVYARIILSFVVIFAYAIQFSDGVYAISKKEKIFARLDNKVLGLFKRSRAEKEKEISETL